MASCQACGQEIEQVRGGHRPRVFCDERCRQAAFRARQREKRQEMLRSRWAPFTQATQEELESLLHRYGEEVAASIAATLVREMEAQRHLAPHQGEDSDCRKKL